MSEALLTTVARGDRLELAAAGAWTVDCASDLETLVDAAVAQAKSVKSVAINMANVERRSRHLRAGAGDRSVDGERYTVLHLL